MNLTMPFFDRARVLVVGDVMLDRYWHGNTSRISPEAPVPVIKVNQSEERPGGAANVALNIAALGAAACLICTIGDDDAGIVLQNRLKAASIHTDFQISRNKPTITKLRVISRHQQILRMDFEESFDARDSNEFARKAGLIMPQMDALVLSDYAKGSLQDCQALIAMARMRRIPVLVDPKGKDFSRYRGATLLTPNLQEFEQVVGGCDSEQQMVSKGSALMQELDLQALLVPRGEQGMTLLRPNQPELHLPARAREVFDVTGAGDTVIAVVDAVMASGQPITEADRKSVV